MRVLILGCPYIHSYYQTKHHWEKKREKTLFLKHNFKNINRKFQKKKKNT